MTLGVLYETVMRFKTRTSAISFGISFGSRNLRRRNGRGTAETSGKSPLILIEAGSPDENGFFDVTVNAENLEFLVSEIALRYDGKTVCPVGTDGEPAKDFSDFAKAVRFDGVSRIGEKLDAEKGYFLFTLFANPGTESDYVWNIQVHFGEKTELYRFRFKKVADGDYGFSLASAMTAACTTRSSRTARW